MQTIEKRDTKSKHSAAVDLLTPAISGKRISISVDKLIPIGIHADEGTRINKCRLDYSFRQGLRRDNSGRIIPTPMLRATERVIEAASTNDAREVYKAGLNFYNTRCREMAKEFEKIAKTRNAHSAMLVGVGQYKDDLFTGDNYLNGNVSSLQPWQIGLGSSTMNKLGLNDGDYAILSRYPTTRVVAVSVVDITEASDDVVYLPVGKIRLGGEITSVADLLDGDLDGDQYVIRTVKSSAAKRELETGFRSFWAQVEPRPLETTVMTWKDHQEHHQNPIQMAYQKALSKSAIGSITLDFYAAFAYLTQLQAAGVETVLNHEDLRQMMTDALEGAFDLKHGQKSDPMALHALMLGMKSIDEARNALESQGLDMDRIGKLADMLDGRSVRDLANHNLPFAIAHGNVDFNPVQRFINGTPNYRPQDFLVALMAAKLRPSAMAYDAVCSASTNARGLAAVYRDTMFSSL